MNNEKQNENKTVAERRGPGGSPVNPQPAETPPPSESRRVLECGTSVPLLAGTLVPRTGKTPEKDAAASPSPSLPSAFPAAPGRETKVFAQSGTEVPHSKAASPLQETGGNTGEPPVPLPSRHARRAFFAKLAAAVGVAALLPRPLRAALQLDAPKITDGDFSGDATIPSGKTLTIKAGATIRAETGANILGWPTGGSGDGGDTATAPKFALFEIPLGIHGAEWTDFELKGSINNFTGLAAEALCYFYGSAYGNSGSTHGPIGTTLACFFTDSLGGANHGLARQWRLKDERVSIFEQLYSANSRVGGVLVVVPVGGEIRPDNDKLRFVWQRVTASYMEEVWVPVTPKWAVSAPLAGGGTQQPGGGGGLEVCTLHPWGSVLGYRFQGETAARIRLSVSNTSAYPLQMLCQTTGWGDATGSGGGAIEGGAHIVKEATVLIPAGQTGVIEDAGGTSTQPGIFNKQDVIGFRAYPTFVGLPAADTKPVPPPANLAQAFVTGQAGGSFSRWDVQG